MWLNAAVACLVFLLASEINCQSRSCTTPNGERASCVSIYSCSVLYNVVSTKDRSQVKFLQDSQCGYDNGPLVCCGTSNNFRSNQGTTRTRTPSTRTPNRQGGGGSQNNDCGLQLADRIVGGTTTAINEFPWMALLQYRDGSGVEKFACGGTLISPQYVLTAAHCITGSILSKVGRLVNVRLGEHNTDTDPDCIQTQSGFDSCNNPPENVGIERTIPHPNYNDNSVNRYHDIGLVKLNRRVSYTEFIRSICLPSPSDESNVGDEVNVAGWGRTETRNFSPVKLKVQLPIAEKSTCTSRFRSAGVSISDAQLCAGGVRGKDSCTGDSGGPLMRARRDSSLWYIEGIVSFGAKCGTEGWPGIYTKVSEYSDWINNNI